VRQQASRAEPIGCLNRNPSHFRRHLEDFMEKKILQYSYWLGVACVAVALVWRAAAAMGFGGGLMMQGISLTYTSFLKGALLFLLTAVATGAYQAGNRN
jgi:uncharacterized membrane protein YkgB